MAKTSAGVLLYRIRPTGPEVLLVHPGGPIWARKDAGAWSIPKGEIMEGEEPLSAAIREFQEETGGTVEGPFASLGSIRQAGGKTVHAFAAEGDFDVATVRSSTFQLEWPPRSGRTAKFPEVDRAGWFSLPDAHEKINPAQRELLARIASGLVP